MRMGTCHAIAFLLRFLPDRKKGDARADGRKSHASRGTMKYLSEGRGNREGYLGRRGEGWKGTSE